MPNVYDFDDTIVRPNSGITFVVFCMWRNNELLRYLPRLGRELISHAIKDKGKKPFKVDFFGFMKEVPDWEEEVRLFWELKADTMLRPWYLEQKRADDIIVSDSPDFLLRPLCEQLGVRMVTTRVDPRTGLQDGPNCYGLEKLRRLREAFGPVEIEDFYSDSLSDKPLARQARRAWLVKKDERVPWPQKRL